MTELQCYSSPSHQEDMMRLQNLTVRDGNADAAKRNDVDKARICANICEYMQICRSICMAIPNCSPVYTTNQLVLYDNPIMF